MEIRQPLMSIRLTTFDEVSNIAISILVMQALKRFGELKSATIWKLRIAFVLSQLLKAVFLVLTARRLKQSNDQRKVKVPK